LSLRLECGVCQRKALRKAVAHDDAQKIADAGLRLTERDASEIHGSVAALNAATAAF
jgi:hypothetical protein